MSNPQTFYTVGGLDLSNIFQPLSLGSSALVTGYKFGNTGADLNSIFAAYPGSGTQASATGYKVGVNDLNTIFAKYEPYVPFSITSSNISNVTITSTTQNGYNIYTFKTTSEVGSKNVWSPGTCIINFSKNANISVILVGGGGGGGANENTFSGGGGGGGVFNLTTANVSTGVNYSLQVGSGGTKYVDGNQDGQSSTLSGGSINLSVNGGNQGVNATTSSNGAGGTSSNGGNGGNGGNPGSSGSNGSYNNYTTVYGSILNIGGGGGGGSKSITSSFIGYGYGGSNGTGGAAGNNSSTNLKPGVGFGAAGGGAPGNTTSGSSTAVGGQGHSGLVIIYIAN
jgi:hypothetical protein